MNVRLVLLVVALLLPSSVWCRFGSRKFGRRCYFCPKPLASSIKQCMGSVSDVESEIMSKLGGKEALPDLSRDQFVGKANPDLANELMKTFAWVRCFAIRVRNFFTTQEIQKINEIELSLTEINRNPKVCVFDNFMTDCQVIDTKNTTSLYLKLQKQWIILDVLLQKTGES